MGRTAGKAKSFLNRYKDFRTRSAKAEELPNLGSDHQGLALLLEKRGLNSLVLVRNEP